MDIFRAILACPREPPITPLVSRILRDYGSQIIGRAWHVIPTVLRAVCREHEPLDALCESLRSARLGTATPIFASAIQLARNLLQHQQQSSIPVYAEAEHVGEKRRRQNVETAGLAQSTEDEKWHAGAGRAVLAALARSCKVHGTAESTEGMAELALFMHRHHMGVEVAFMIKTHLHSFITRRSSLAALLKPLDDVDVACRLGDAVIEGIPGMARLAAFGLLLLALVELVLSLDGAPTPTQLLDSFVDANPASVVSITALCDSFYMSLPSVPVEPVYLDLVDVPPASSCLDVLGVRLVVAPVSFIAAGYSERILLAVVRSWPTSNSNDNYTLTLLALLLRHSLHKLLCAFVSRTLPRLLAHKPAFDLLTSALFASGKMTRMALWEGAIQALSTLFAANNPFTLVHEFVSILTTRVKASAVAASVGECIWNPHAKYTSFLGDLVKMWPKEMAGKDGKVAACAVMRALVLVGDEASAILLLQRLPAKVLLECMDEQYFHDVPFRTPASSHSFGLFPYGEALGRAIAAAFISGFSGQDGKHFNLVAAIEVVYLFFRAVSFASGEHSLLINSDVCAIALPVVSTCTDAALGITLYRSDPLSESGCEFVARFLLDPRVTRVLHDKYPTGVAGAWLKHASSALGGDSSLYSVTPLACLVKKALSPSSSLNLPRSALLLVIDALITVETPRLALPFPELRWARGRLCVAECKVNPNGPSSCDRISEFLADPDVQQADFYFTNRSKQKHVVKSLHHSNTVRENDRTVTIMKGHDAVASDNHARAAKQYECDRERLAELIGMRRDAEDSSAA